jgi:hypothetical protein
MFSTLFILLVETYTYQGFIRKYLFFPSNLFFYLSLFSSYFYFSVSRIKKSDVANKLFITINELIFIPIAIIYYFLIVIEASNFPNYVFANYHLTPDNFSRVLILSTFILCLNHLPNLKMPILKNESIYSINIIKYLFFFLIFIFVLIQAEKVFSEIVKLATLTVKGVNYSFEDRFSVKSGEGIIAWSYEYTKFIKANTEENSTIFIPPQKDVWKSTGNLHYMRGFLYPRKLIDSKTEYDVIPQGTDYVMISWGAWGGDNHGWPKIEISEENVEKIILIDRNTKVTQTFAGSYIPDLAVQKWGLIKLNKSL